MDLHSLLALIKTRKRRQTGRQFGHRQAANSPSTVADFLERTHQLEYANQALRSMLPHDLAARVCLSVNRAGNFVLLVEDSIAGARLRLLQTEIDQLLRRFYGAGDKTAMAMRAPGSTPKIKVVPPAPPPRKPPRQPVRPVTSSGAEALQAFAEDCDDEDLAAIARKIATHTKNRTY